MVVGLGAIAACLTLPSLSTTRQEVTSVSPGTFDFGTVQVGSSSAVQTFTVAPAGSGTSIDEVTSVTGCPGFPVTANGLPATVSRTCTTGSGSGITCTVPMTYTFTASFVPLVAAVSSCDVQVSTAPVGSGGGSGAVQIVALHGTGIRPDHVIEVSQNAIDFGEVRIGTNSSPAPFDITSAGRLALNISSVTLNDPAGVFQIVTGNKLPHSLAPDQKETYSLRCKPPLAQGYAGSIDFASDDPKTPLLSVTLACTGVDSNLDFNPTALDFPTTRVAEPSSASVILHNAGGATMTLQAITLGTNPKGELAIASAPPGGEKIPAGADATVPVKLTYSAATAQSIRDVVGSLQVTYDAAPPRTLSITGQALVAQVASEPNDLDFGGVCIGATAQHTIDIYAVLEGTFTVDSASTDAPFAVVPQNPLPGSTGPNGTMQVRFDVSVMPDAAGPLAATVTVVTDAPTMTAYPVPVKVFGLPLGIAATPDQVAFPTVKVNTVSSAQTVTFSNCGTTSIQLLGAELQGAQASEFIITKPIDAPIDVGASGSHDIDLQIEPRSSGAKHAELVITYTGGTITVPLTGAGSLDRGSYYACSSGRDVELWPIGLALLAIARRRRV